MHEFAVAQSLVETASVEARRAGAQRVTVIHCRIGVLRQVNSDLLNDAFSLARQGTLCESAELRIDKVPVKANCRRCNHEYTVRDWQWDCPKCGAEAAELTGGDELLLVSIEADVADEDSGPQERL